MPSMPVWRRLRAVPAHVLGNLPKPSAKFGRFGLEVGGFLAALGQGRQVPLDVAPPREDLLGHLTVWHLTPSARDGWTSRIRLDRATSTALVPDGAIASAGMRCASCSRPATGSGIVGHGTDVPARSEHGWSCSPASVSGLWGLGRGVGGGRCHWAEFRRFPAHVSGWQAYLALAARSVAPDAAPSQAPAEAATI
jgi:hypothetical protein